MKLLIGQGHLHVVNAAYTVRAGNFSFQYQILGDFKN